MAGASSSNNNNNNNNEIINRSFAQEGKTNESVRRSELVEKFLVNIAIKIIASRNYYDIFMAPMF